MSPLEISNREVFGVVGAMSVSTAVLAFVYFRIDRVMRGKGYQSPFRGMGSFAAFFLSLAVGVYLGGSESGICWECSPAKSTGGSREPRFPPNHQPNSTSTKSSTINLLSGITFNV